VSRILSSLPLLKVHLPPVVVSSNEEMKRLYFEALQAADEDSDVCRLAEFLQQQALNGMEQIDKLPSDKTLSTSCPGSGKADLPDADPLVLLVGLYDAVFNSR
jgi:hypothetical protein